MHLRCPYCQTTLASPPPAKCPQCGKAFVVPDHLRTRSYRDRRRARQRVHHELEQKHGAHRRLPSWKRSPLQTIGLLVGMALVGAMLILRARQTAPPQPAISQGQRAQSELNVLRAALEQFRQHCGRYPATREGLTALISNPDLPGWQGPYVTLVRHDPWRTPYRYTADANTVALVSSGPDGQPDTADDLRPAGWEALLYTAP